MPPKMRAAEGDHLRVDAAKATMARRPFPSSLSLIVLSAAGFLGRKLLPKK